MTRIPGVTKKVSLLKFSLVPTLVLIAFSLVLIVRFAASDYFLTLNRIAFSDTRSELRQALCLQKPSEPAAPEGGTTTTLPTGKALASTKLVLANSPQVQETLASKEFVTHWNDLTELAPKGLRTWIDTNEEVENARYFRYGIAPVKNLCVRPNGRLVVVGVSQEEFSQNLLESGEDMIREWNLTYALRIGVEFVPETPEGALWVSGNTTHFIAYQNVFHDFAERIWPHVSGFKEPVNQYYMHEMQKWLNQADSPGAMDRNTILYQLTILARMSGPGTKLLQHTDAETRPVCFESFKLASTTTGRMNPRFGVENYTPSLERFRNTAFEYFDIPKPQVSVPPHPLRVTVYGRRDARRRRVHNIVQVAEHLRNWAGPPLLVTHVDEILQSGAYNQSLPEVVSLMSQTDVLISVHGASTWATSFMPRQAAVIEITGPCGPPSWLGRMIAPALQLKHDPETNPWGERVASPVAGNTTECKTAYDTPDFTVSLNKLDTALRKLSLPSGLPGDRFPLHWLYDWKKNSY